MDFQELRTLVDYHYWARDRVLQAAESLTEEQLTAETDKSLAPNPENSTNYMGNGVIMGRPLAVVPEPAGIIYLHELGVQERIAWLRPVCNGANCVAWCYYHNKHWYSNNHQGGGNLIFADGHAKYRTLFSIHSGDFGLTPDRPQNPADNKACDPGLKRAF